MTRPDILEQSSRLKHFIFFLPLLRTARPAGEDLRSMMTTGLPRRTLRDIIDSVPVTDPDLVADSCSDISDDFEPQPLPSPHTHRPLGYVNIDTNTAMIGSSSRNLNASKNTAVDEKLKYQVSKSAQTVHYFMVQWCVVHGSSWLPTRIAYEAPPRRKPQHKKVCPPPVFVAAIPHASLPSPFEMFSP